MAKIKTAPKIIIAVLLAGGIYYAADKFIPSSGFKQLAPQQQAEVTQEQQASAQPPQQQEQYQQPVQQAQQPAPQQLPPPEPAGDAGMAKLLQSGRK